jgi:glycosyltransferase involved in cell wall biosynthesis
MTETPIISIISSVFRGLDYLDQFLIQVTCQTILSRCELILVHNSPDKEELEIVKRFMNLNCLPVKHLIVDVEYLSMSWNRGIKAAKGEYIAFWNVDDRREPDSLERQLTVLQRNPNAWLTYGDYVEVSYYGEESGYLYSPAAYKEGTETTFINNMETGGAFLLFRRGICDKIGFFDEQFRCALDYEFISRILANRLSIIKTEGLIGYFTNQNSGLSTRDNHRTCDLENAVVQKRYGAYDRVKREILNEITHYQIGNILVGGDWQPIERWVNGYRAFLAWRKHLWILGYFRAVIRWVLMKVGLWELYLERKANKARCLYVSVNKTQ